MARTWVDLDLGQPIWDRFLSVAPLVVIGTREEDGSPNLAPKHMVVPLGWSNFVGFVCTPAHRTYGNVAREQAFTLSYIGPDQVVLASLTAAPRWDDDSKPAVSAVPTEQAGKVSAPLVSGAYVQIECALERLVDGFDENVLVAGRVVAARVDARALRYWDRDDQDLLAEAPLLAFLPPAGYATIDRVAAFPFHEGFSR